MHHGFEGLHRKLGISIRKISNRHHIFFCHLMPGFGNGIVDMNGMVFHGTIRFTILHGKLTTVGATNEKTICHNSTFSKWCPDGALIYDEDSRPLLECMR